ncbi:DNA-binding response regulator, partial [Enterococcus faecalis]
MNILMIEDNESVSEMMQMFFLNEGWDATFQYDGQAVLDTFLAEPDRWDMVTLDLN